MNSLTPKVKSRTTRSLRLDHVQKSRAHSLHRSRHSPPGIGNRAHVRMPFSRRVSPASRFRSKEQPTRPLVNTKEVGGLRPVQTRFPQAAVPNATTVRRLRLRLVSAACGKRVLDRPQPHPTPLFSQTDTPEHPATHARTFAPCAGHLHTATPRTRHSSQKTM